MKASPPAGERSMRDHLVEADRRRPRRALRIASGERRTGASRPSNTANSLPRPFILRKGRARGTAMARAGMSGFRVYMAETARRIASRAGREGHAASASHSSRIARPACETIRVYLSVVSESEPQRRFPRREATHAAIRSRLDPPRAALFDRRAVAAVAGDRHPAAASADPPPRRPSRQARQGRRSRNSTPTAKSLGKKTLAKVIKTEEEWRKQLSAVAFIVARQEGTERAYHRALVGTTTTPASSAASAAIRRSSTPTPSSIPAPAGRASGSRSPRRTSSRSRTRALG